MNLMSAVQRVAVFTLLIFVSTIAASAQTDSIYRLTAGTRITLKLDAELSSGVAGVNDTFLATVTKPVRIRDTVVLPVGTVIEGRVTTADAAGTGGKSGKLDLAFETVSFGGDIRRTIDGGLVNKLSAKSGGVFSVISILGGAAIGTALGAISGSRSGILIGAGVGAGAGTGVALFRKGKDVRIRKGQEFEIELKKDVTLPVIDY